jgi:uncharacterized membrane protein
MPQRPLLPRFIAAQPRLILATALGVATMAAMPGAWEYTTRLLIAWDSAVVLYLALSLTMMARSNIDTIRSRTALQDSGRWAILLLTVAVAVASLAAIVIELGIAKNLQGHDKAAHIALAGATVLLSWGFMHTIFAIHYAHEYYAKRGNDIAGGLEFPGKQPPDYWDFIYYSFIIGTAAATADVNTLSKHMRNLTAIQCIIAFFFNTTILALCINIGASLI